MPRTLSSPRHRALRDFLVQKRKKAGLTQHELAALLERPQSYVASIETAQRRVDLVELLELAEALRFDPQAAVRHIKK